jgi:hypothetical protein
MFARVSKKARQTGTFCGVKFLKYLKYYKQGTRAPFKTGAVL